MIRAMAWADVIHWHWADTTWGWIDLRIAALLRKPRVIEFWGDDLRDPQMASRDNPFLARMYELNPDLAIHHGRTVQRIFKRCGFEALIPGYELFDYLDPHIFPGYYQTRACLLLDEYTPRFPDQHQKQPLLLHAPSNKARKGTEALQAILAELSLTCRFDFKLVHQMARKDAIAAMSECDLFLDQFTIGAEGLAAHEAMALGKPVVCFIKDSLRPRYPASFPVVSADQDNLGATIASLIKDGDLRRELGIRGRQYMEQFHDARKIAGELLDIYRDLASRTGQESRNPAVGRSPYWHQLQASAETASAACRCG
jgi:hypothetical protein